MSTSTGQQADHSTEVSKERPQSQSQSQSQSQQHSGAPSQSQSSVEGEGSYSAARAYNDASRAFAESGRVDKAASEAAPRDEAEAHELAQAEAAGKERLSEEDPRVDGGRSRADQGGQD